MKYTLNEAITRINQTLNYPSATYEDLAVFFDQAIAELNTSLHIAIDPISRLIYQAQKDIATEPLIVLTRQPDSITTIPTTETKPCWYDTTAETFKVFQNDKWLECPRVYGVYYTTDGPKYYQTVKITVTIIYWGLMNEYDIGDFNLTTILPINWITLFLIPYVCFKYSVRDGDNGALYSEEFQQGFQQLQDAYDIPSTVNLADVADLPAYRDLVTDNLPNLNKLVRTKAITESMLHDRQVMPTYGGMFDNGGWGL